MEAMGELLSYTGPLQCPVLCLGEWRAEKGLPFPPEVERSDSLTPDSHLVTFILHPPGVHVPPTMA